MRASKKKVISINLTDPASIDEAIKAIEEYQKWLDDKMDILRRKVADFIKIHAESGFKGAIGDDVIKGSTVEPKVDVTVNHEGDGKVSIVIADGKDAVFIEFGAGIYHNTSVGGSLHPWVNTPNEGTGPGVDRFRIGLYGDRHGAQSSWGFYRDHDKNDLVVTRGTVAEMPMYHAVQALKANLPSIVREVFGTE